MRIIFLGSQGSGKSTQAKLIAQKLGLSTIEMGQLLRDKAQDKDKEAKLIKESLQSGHLVQDEIVIDTLKKRLQKDDCQKGFILDGFPRNDAQLAGLPENIIGVFYIKVSDREALKRLKKRGRSDDTKEALAKRLKIYHSETEPLLEVFKIKGILYEINGERSIEDIHKDVWQKVQKL